MSQEDELLEALAAAMGDDGPPGDEQRLEALTRGELSDDELSTLEARAEDDAKLAEALAAHTPVGPEARERFVEVALSSLQTATPETGEEPTSSVSSPPRRHRVRAVALLLPLVAAALVWLLLRPSPAPPLPSYELTVLADASTRAQPSPSDEGPPTLSAGSRLRLVLRPDRPARGEVVARAAIVHRGTVEPLPVAPDVADTGAIKIEGERSALFGARRGDVVVRVVVGRPDRVEQGLRADGSQGDGWRRYDTPIRLPP